MATRRLRPEDWAPVPQTRIQIRAASGSREPRDERAHVPKCAQKPPRPTPINYPPGELPPIAQGRDSLDTDSPRAPEIVDLAAPTTWPRRGLPPHIVYQHQQWGGRRVGSPSSVSQYSSRQSEMSFGILDYYTRDPSPTRSETLPPTPKLPQIAQDAPKIGTPVIDPAMEKFDFGLPLKAARLQSPPPEKQDAFETATATPQANAGAQQQERGSVPPIPPPKSDKSEAAKPTYSLFPKDTTARSRPSLSLANRQDSSPTQITAPTHQHPDPSYRPRKESLSASLRSRKDSCTSHRPAAARIPLRVLPSASPSPSSAYTTPRTSHTTTTTTARASSSSTTSPPTSASSGARSASRWSDDTITSPTAAASAPPHPRASFGSLLRDVGAGERGPSGQYPACFFEDDDDEVVPLRRKLAWGSRGAKGGSASGWEREWEGRRGRRWRRWVLCGCGG